MLSNAWGVVLSRRDLGEADRLATLYTESLGKILVRFSGVKKPARKLKALSEPMVWGEYRLYLGRSEAARAAGGQIVSSFPSIRADLGRTVLALSALELLSQLTPERSPNSSKYRLICATLVELEAGESPWLEAAYGLRLLELCGLSLRSRPAPGAEGAFWEALHDAPLGELRGLPADAPRARALRELVYAHAEAQSGRPLKARGFRESLGGPLPAGVRPA